MARNATREQYAVSVRPVNVTPEDDWQLVEVRPNAPSERDGRGGLLQHAGPSAGSAPRRVFPSETGCTVDGKAVAAKKKPYIVIRAGLVIPGDGEPFEDGALVVEGKLIAWVGAEPDLPQEYLDAPHREYSVPYLMPGLWDCHVHFGSGGQEEATMGYAAFLTVHAATAGARLARGCWESLQRGYTSVRDVAGYGCEVARAVDDGSIVGPNIYSSGACLSQTAGHGDVFNLPAGDVHRNLGVATIPSGEYGTRQCCIVDGVDECRRAVRLQIRRGARCIKVLASGGVMSLDDDPLRAQFSPEELDVIVAEAARQGRAVAAHAHGKPGILAAVRAGVTTVEHVSFGDEECVRLIKDRGAVYVATRYVVDALVRGGGEGLDPRSYEKALLCATNHLRAYRLAIRAGVTCALGTDTAPGADQAAELELAVEAGMTNLEAIRAATAHGPLTLGAQAPRTGRLRAGHEADLLGVLENPAEDVRVLRRRENIGWVWKGGRIFKGPGVGPWGEEE